MNKDVKDFQKHCKMFEVQIRNLKKDVDIKRFNYFQTREDIISCAYFQNRLLTDVENRILSDLHRDYLKTFMNMLELRERYYNYSHQFKWLSGI